MELVFQSTKAFEKDLRKLSPADRNLVIDRVNRYAQLFLRNRKTFISKTHRPFPVKLQRGLDSSLYSMRINHRVRVITSFDDDPLFNQVIITLFRIAKSPDELSKVFSSVVESLYQSQLVELDPRESDNDPD